MLIDTHVHVFPDKIAEKAISALSAAAHKEPSTNGTISDTLKARLRVPPMRIAVAGSSALLLMQQIQTNWLMAMVNVKKLKASVCFYMEKGGCVVTEK